jgi:mannose-6-phosphate isomerase-like protein (cupin superfamily)
MRRVVTGHKDGKSVIVDNAEISSEDIPAYDILGGIMISPFWETKNTPSIPVKNEDLIQKPGLPFPGPGGSRVSIAWLPPDEEVINNAKEKGLDAEEKWRELCDDDWGMHTTDSIDIDIILSGELWMELDDEAEVHLKQGDCVVQNGTRHAWRNRSDEVCVIASFIVGANRN